MTERAKDEAGEHRAEGGTWFDDMDADSHTTKEHGEVNSLITT